MLHSNENQKINFQTLHCLTGQKRGTTYKTGSHSLLSFWKYPKLAANWSDVIGCSRSQSKKVSKSIIVPHQQYPASSNASLSWWSNQKRVAQPCPVAKGWWGSLTGGREAEKDDRS